MLEFSETLSIAAVTLGLLHTAAGPDHYLPFIAMSRIGRWSLKRTIAITLLCGLGHVLSSAALGWIGIFFGFALGRLNAIESARGVLSSWLLIGFGLATLAWGLRQAIRNRPHTHLHVHANGTVHRHAHIHSGEHMHLHGAMEDHPGVFEEAAPHATESKAESLTPWVLFTIFLFGPCEVLIPMVMVPAANGDMWGVAWVTTLFGAATLATMIAIVVAASIGVRSFRWAPLERYGQAFAGLVVLGCGVAIKFGL